MEATAIISISIIIINRCEEIIAEIIEKIIENPIEMGHSLKINATDHHEETKSMIEKDSAQEVHTRDGEVARLKIDEIDHHEEIKWINVMIDEDQEALT